MLKEEEFMLKAIELAKESLILGEVPVGAIVVNKDDEIISTAFNQRETQNSPTAHAEIIAIEKAARFLNSRFLDGCTIYITLEPCLMCAGAIMLSRIKRIVYGAYAEKTGALSSVMNVYENGFGYKPRIRGGILENECRKLMNDFGKSLRLNMNENIQ